MNIVLTVHPGKSDAFKVTLSAPSEAAPALIDSELDGYSDDIALACAYLSGLDGKIVTLGGNATVVDVAIIIGKYHKGDIEVSAGRIPASLLDDPMTDQEDSEQ